MYIFLLVGFVLLGLATVFHLYEENKSYANSFDYALDIIKKLEKFEMPIQLPIDELVVNMSAEGIFSEEE